MARVLAAAREHGKFAGHPAASADEIRRAMDQGFLFSEAATKLDLMATGALGLLAALGRQRDHAGASAPSRRGVSFARAAFHEFRAACCVS